MNWQWYFRSIALALLVFSLAACTIHPIEVPGTEQAGTAGGANSAVAANSTSIGSKGGGYCVLSPDGTGSISEVDGFSSAGSAAYGSGGSLLGEIGGARSHGDLVWKSLQDELKARGAEPISITSDLQLDAAPVVVLVTDQFSTTNESRIDREEMWIYPGEDMTDTVSPAGLVAGTLLLVGLDIQDFRVEQATEQLSNAVRAYSDGATVATVDGGELGVEPVTKFVVNMSFVETPCDLLPESREEYLKAICTVATAAKSEALDKLLELQALLKSFKEDNAQSMCASILADTAQFDPDDAPKELFDKLTASPIAGQLMLGGIHEQGRISNTVNVDASDALSETVNCLGTEPSQNDACGATNQVITKNQGLTVINVAAAGNSGMNYPFAPATWNSVISVSASEVLTITDVATSSDVTTTTLASYSNAGEIMLPGGHTDTVHYGTSFAAPRLSAWAALYLLNGGSSPCTGNSDNADVKPVLGFKGDDKTNDAGDMNMALPAAIATFCPSSPLHE